MGLPINHSTLDTDIRGMPYVAAPTTLLDMGTLDNEGRGMPVWMEPLLIALDPCVITITAPAVKFLVVQRAFPNKRAEMVGETQVKQIVPLFGIQDTASIP